MKSQGLSMAKPKNAAERQPPGECLVVLFGDLSPGEIGHAHEIMRFVSCFDGSTTFARAGSTPNKVLDSFEPPDVLDFVEHDETKDFANSGNRFEKVVR
jgi:hypothetical protein